MRERFILMALRYSISDKLLYLISFIHHDAEIQENVAGKEDNITGKRIFEGAYHWF